MEKKLKIDFDKLIISFFVIYITTMYIWGNYTDTLVYSQLAFYVLFSLMGIYYFRGSAIKLSVSFWMMGTFVLYSFFTCFWAIDPNYAFAKSKTIFILWIFSTMIYCFFSKKDYIKIIPNALLIAGVSLSIYILAYYGVREYFTLISMGERVGTDINNVNAIGLQTGITVIICFYEAMQKGKKYLYFIAVIPFIVSMGTGSRKALVLIVIGMLLLYLLQIQKGKRIKKIIQFMIISFVIIFVLQMPIFQNVMMYRIDSLINLVTGNGKVDHSALERKAMVDIGWNQFLKKPLLGIGMDNAKYVVREHLGRFVYMHNNFVELLVNGGIIGFLLYYSMYVYIFIKQIPFLKAKDDIVILSFIILFLQVIMDYGVVSYYTKTTYVYLIFGFLSINKNRKIIKKDEME